MSDPLLTIRHHHVPGCGDPPIVSVDRNFYIVYFANAHSEQWIFTRDERAATTLDGTMSITLSMASWPI